MDTGRGIDEKPLRHEAPITHLDIFSAMVFANLINARRPKVH